MYPCHRYEQACLSLSKSTGLVSQQLSSSPSTAMAGRREIPRRFALSAPDDSCVLTISVSQLSQQDASDILDTTSCHMGQSAVNISTLRFSDMVYSFV